MNSWKANWSGAIQNFPGLESIISGFDELETEAKQEVEHAEEVINTYFANHTGKNGSVAVEGTAIEGGEHSHTMTIAAIPQAVNTPAEEGEQVAQPDQLQPGDPGPDAPSPDAAPGTLIPAPGSEAADEDATHNSTPIQEQAAEEPAQPDHLQPGDPGPDAPSPDAAPGTLTEPDPHNPAV